MSYLVLGLCTLVGLGLLGRLLVNTNPHSIAQGVRLGGGLLLGIAGLFLTLRGLFFVGGPIAFFGLMMFARGLGWQGAPGFGIPGFGGLGGSAPSGGGESSVRTRYLDMSLDHESGEMDGLVREGDFLGRRLSELSRTELEELLRRTRLDDPDSARLVEAFLDRAFPDRETEGEAGNGAGTGPSGGPSGGPMTVREALEILELTEDADEAAVREAHKRMMKHHHPDQGGSAWYAAKINQARDVLLSR